MNQLDKNFRFNESTKRVLSVIVQNQPVSRKKIAEITGYSKAAVSYSIEELLKQQIIIEKGCVSASKKGGPRPISLYVNESYAVILSILLRKQDPKLQISSLNGKVIKTYSFSKFYYDDFVQMLKESISLSKKAVKEFSLQKVLGVGISIPGNVKHNKVINSPYYNVKEIDIVQIFQEALQTDVYIERDVYNMAHGEHWKGHGKKYQDFITVWAGTGIGSAIVIDSKLVKGMQGFAGEMGFMATDLQIYKAKPCTLNEFGYFETMASAKKLETKYNLPFEKICEKAKADKKIKQEIYQLCDKLAMGLANVIVLLNPQAIIINGRFKNIDEDTKEYLCQQIKTICPIHCQIEYSALGVKAITLGGTYLVLKNKLGVEF